MFPFIAPGCVISAQKKRHTYIVPSSTYGCLQMENFLRPKMQGNWTLERRTQNAQVFEILGILLFFSIVVV